MIWLFRRGEVTPTGANFRVGGWWMSRPERWMVLNAETGELERVINTEEIGRRRRGHPYHQPGRFAWYTVSSEEYGAVIRSLKGADLHVFAALPLLMSKDNVLLCRQTEICAATGLSPAAISSAMKEMRKQMLIGEIDGVLRFSPEIAWKGYATDLQWALNRWRGAKVGWIKDRRQTNCVPPLRGV